MDPLVSLGELEADDEVLPFHLSSASRIFMLFVRADGRSSDTFGFGARTTAATGGGERMSEKTVRELGGEVWAELSRLPDAQLHWKRDEQVVDLVMGVLARHLGASIQNDRDLPVSPCLRRDEQPPVTQAAARGVSGAAGQASESLGGEILASRRLDFPAWNALALRCGAALPSSTRPKRLYADFNDFTADGTLPLTCAGSVVSIAEQTEPLVEGEEVWLSDGSLRTRGRVHRAEDGRWAARPTWHFSDGDESA